MGEHSEDQEHGAEPARPPLTSAQAREMTTGLREAMDDIRRSGAVLAARVHDAHRPLFVLLLQNKPVHLVLPAVRCSQRA